MPLPWHTSISCDPTSNKVVAVTDQHIGKNRNNLICNQLSSKLCSINKQIRIPFECRKSRCWAVILNDDIWPSWNIFLIRDYFNEEHGIERAHLPTVVTTWQPQLSTILASRWQHLLWYVICSYMATRHDKGILSLHHLVWWAEIYSYMTTKLNGLSFCLAFI